MADTKEFAQIQITRKSWRDLIQLKTEPSQTFDDIIQILIKGFKLQKEEN